MRERPERTTKNVVHGTSYVPPLVAECSFYQRTG